MPAADNPVFLVPLSKLVPSPDNVRRTGRETGIAELAASIAAHSLLQNLTVTPVLDAEGNETGKFAVVAGQRRLAALKLLAKQKRILKTYPVPCARVTADIEEVSLAENALQVPMHPADQYEAFARLNERGLAAEDIAARFGVTPAVVKQRLRLGAVSPVIMQAYRDDELTLGQVMAFTITEDHGVQERVYRELSWNREAAYIRRILTEGHVEANDRRVRFITVEAYKAAGGALIRDLFQDDHEGWLIDVALVNRLTMDKLEDAAAPVRAEGWKWVAAHPEFHYGMAAGMRRIYPRDPVLNETEAAQLAALEAEYEALSEQHDGADELDEATAETFAKLEAAIAAIAGTPVYAPEDVARAGAFVTLDHAGALRIERGYMKPEDTPPAETRAAMHDRDGAVSPEIAGDTNDAGAISDRLAAELSAHRTAALRARLAANGTVALIAVVHALALSAFYHRPEQAVLQIAIREAALEPHAPTIGGSLAAQDLAATTEAWAAKLPREPQAFWTYLRQQSPETLMSLLAALVAPAVNMLALPHARMPSLAGDALAQDLDLDMTAYWQATAEGYFAKLTKVQIVTAISEAAGEVEAERIAHLKKPEMAKAAEAVVKGRGWLPEMLRHSNGHPQQHLEAAE